MIKIFPSRLVGEPLETHHHDKTSLLNWFYQNVKGFTLERNHPIVLELNGKELIPEEWENTIINPDDDIKIFPKPYAIGAAVSAWVYVYYAIVAAVALYSVYMILSMSSQGAANNNSNGDGLELNPAKANSAKLGDPIREIFGKQRIYPDYLVQPVNRFVSGEPETYKAHLFLCIGIGEYTINKNDIRIGNTPITALGDDVEYTIYPPNADVSHDPRSENWWTSTEVSGTSMGAGLDMAVTAPDGNIVSATSATVNGYSVSFDIPTIADKNDFSNTWTVNKTVTLNIYDVFDVTNQNGYSRISGTSLIELNAYVGMPVTLYIDKSPYNLIIASIEPETPPEDEKNNGEDEKNNGEDEKLRDQIVIKPKPEEPEQVLYHITLAYEDLTPFCGLGAMKQRLSICHRGGEYKIKARDGLTVIVDRLIDGVVDDTWEGFQPRTVIDFIADNINDKERWLGGFLACPENEKVDAIELNFAFPSGICDWDKKGRKERQTVLWAVEYRYVNESRWVTIRGKWAEKNINGLGYTLRYDLPRAGLVEVRARRRNVQNDDGAHDSMYWQSLRGRLLKRPSSYPNVTTLGITITTGGKLAAQSDRRVNVIATRKYNKGKDRSISGAIKHILDNVKIEYDEATIDEMEENIWTPNKQTFDYQTDQTQSIFDILQKICTAGFAYPYLSDGLLSVGYDGEKNWTGAITPLEMTEPLKATFTAPNNDDFDGVDVTYINSKTWAEETVICRLDDVETPQKIEAFKLAGVVNEDQAYRIGMRRLMRYRYQRLSFTCQTELDGLCYQYGDRIILTDDIPTNKTINCFLIDIKKVNDQAHVLVSDSLNWTFENPKILIKWQDGTVSPILSIQKIHGGFSTPWLSEFDFVVLNDPAIEPPRAIFCEAKQIGYDVIIDSIEPEENGRCTISAHEYQLAYYDYDTAIYPFGDKSYLTSKPYPVLISESVNVNSQLNNIKRADSPYSSINENTEANITLDMVKIRDVLTTYRAEAENVTPNAGLEKITIKDVLNNSNTEDYVIAGVSLDQINIKSVLIREKIPAEEIKTSATVDKITIS